jgi:Na+/melibiose symporter-like transporter
VGQGLAFTTLAWIGFDAKGSNGPDEILGLRIFYSGGPMVLYVIAIMIVWRYPITASRHAELRKELATRGAQSG